MNTQEIRGILNPICYGGTATSNCSMCQKPHVPISIALAISVKSHFILLFLYYIFYQIIYQITNKQEAR